MERGYDKLANPVGQAMIIASLFIITAIMIAGAFAWRRGMQREAELRKEWRENLKEAEKNEAS